MADYTLSAKITGDSRDFEKVILKVQNAMKKTGSDFASMGKKLESIGSRLDKHIARPALQAAKSLGDIALVKLPAMTQTDDARVKLEAMGTSIKDVKDIMDNATGAVKGIAYGLNEAAAAAASAGSGIAGIGGKGITGAISNINASISKTGENFLGSSNDAKSFAGVVLPMLSAFNAGFSALENKVKELHSTFGQAFNAIDGYCKTGRMNFDKLSSSAGGIVSATSPISDRVKELTGSFMGLFPQMQASLGGGAIEAEPLIDAFKRASAVVEYLSNGAAGLKDKLAGIIGSVPGINDVFGGIKKSYEENKVIFSNIKEVITMPFEDLAGKMPKIGGFISGAWDMTGAKLVNGTNGFLGNIMDKFSPLTSAIQAKLSPVLDYMTAWGSLAMEAFSPLLSQVTSFAPTFMSGMNIAAGAGVLLAGLGLIYEQFGPAIDQFIENVRIKGPEMIGKFCEGITAGLPDLIAQGGMMVTNILTAITENIPALIQGGMNIVASLIIGTAQQLPTLIPAAVDMILTLFTALIENLPTLINAGIELAIGLATGIANSIPKIVETVPGMIGSFIATLISKMPEIIIAGGKIILSMAVGLAQAIPQLIAKIPGLISQIRSAVTGVNWWELGGKIIKGIASGMQSLGGALLDAMKSAAKVAVNGLISTINWGIGKANYIPGVNIPNIPYLLHGTNNWQGGFAVMNEGGRGELVNLPGGAQVIPHDISVKYAKEAARSTGAVEPLDMSGILEGVVIQVVNNTNVDGTPLRETISDYTINKIGSQQRAVMRARGAYA